MGGDQDVRNRVPVQRRSLDCALCVALFGEMRQDLEQIGVQIGQMDIIASLWNAGIPSRAIFPIVSLKLIMIVPGGFGSDPKTFSRALLLTVSFVAVRTEPSSISAMLTQA